MLKYLLMLKAVYSVNISEYIYLNNSHVDQKSEMSLTA